MNEQGLKEIGEKFVTDLKDEFDAKGLNDTDEARNSISYSTEPNKLKIEGLARVLFLQYGRRAGTPPPFGIIREWVERKLNPAPEAVYPITKTIVDKIAREGTSILRDNTKGLQIELIVEELTKELSEIIINFEALKITDGLIETWTQIKE